jgi:hypothetical protein
VLLSTVSFTIEQHFCGNTLIDAAVFAKVKSCEKDSDADQMASVIKNECCKDKKEVIKGQDKLKLTTFEELHFSQQLFITSFAYSFLNLFGSLPEQTIPHKNYLPPNLVADIHVLDQVFII